MYRLPARAGDAFVECFSWELIPKMSREAGIE